MSFSESANNHLQSLQELSESSNNLKIRSWSSETRDVTLSDIHTPSKMMSRLSSKTSAKSQCQNSKEDMMDLETTLAIDSQEANKSILDDIAKEKQFDIIATNVNRTIQELNTIYNQIGYSSTEISIKKSEIFTVIEETIMNFTSNLQREKNSIENECEWLRQQIRIILAMINDNNGEKSLTLANRGIVFSNKLMYEQGYKDEILTKLANIQNRRQNFYENSPFNITSTHISDSSFSFECQYEYLLKNIPQLSLLQLKSKLNSIFLEVLRIFVRSFKKLNDLNLKYLDIIEAIGEIYSPNANVVMLKTLPSKYDSEHYRQLIDKFEVTLKYLKLSNSDSKPESLLKLNDKNDDQNAFIISSPRKAKLNKIEIQQHESDIGGNPQSDIENLMNHLRDLNYKIVRVIRNLKITKMAPEILSNIQKEIEYCETDLNERKQRLNDIISTCFQLINILHLSEDQIINIQKQYDINNTKDSLMNDGYFDSDTLKFIQANPKQFGLSDTHLNFFNKFAGILKVIKDSKQKKFDYYLKSCRDLWDKLGESSDYVEKFLNANNSLTDISLMNFKMELNRLYVKRSEFIESFIVNARLEIEKLWDIMYYSNDQRVNFKHYNYDVSDDSLDKEKVLDQHEKELSKLKSEYEAKGTILILYSQLNELIQDQNFLKESSKDSSRLLSKNSCKILLNEEKIRKRINKNMPKLIENLKAEIIKYNNKQLNEGNKPIMINGEDFFERLLIIESEQLNYNNRNSRNRMALRSSQESPNTSFRNRSVRSSPVKSNGIQSTVTAAKSASLNKSKGSLGNRRSPLKLSPSKNQPAMKKAAVIKPIQQKTYNNPTTIKLTNAINSNLSTESSMSSFDSPIKFASRSNSNIAKLVGTSLQPLNSPLIANDLKNSEIYNDNVAADSTHHSYISNISKVSPLKINNNIVNNVNSIANKLRCSPLKKVTNDKEDSTFELSPVKLSDFDRNIGERVDIGSSSQGLSSMTCDSSTIIGDDYQTWRDEKIRQLNDIA